MIVETPSSALFLVWMREQDLMMKMPTKSANLEEDCPSHDFGVDDESEGNEELVGELEDHPRFVIDIDDDEGKVNEQPPSDVVLSISPLRNYFGDPLMTMDVDKLYRVVIGKHIP
ncbi:hypothetical protein LR48_Vigan746s001000 [Vigna angularis]|uniref:Uncharacterized protein n=1 Tax=Phaseolus angularis TaxID=3914 RepID=A0A0L9TGY8_PHAAN|nr:hypothetical protein LR48_Vigan746s001000 [Vigna angularis]